MGGQGACGAVGSASTIRHSGRVNRIVLMGAAGVKFPWLPTALL